MVTVLTCTKLATVQTCGIDREGQESSQDHIKMQSATVTKSTFDSLL